VASIVNSEEVEVSVLSHLTGLSSINSPRLVILSLEVSLMTPFSGKSPGFSSSPVADPILVSRVNKNLNLRLIKNLCNLWHQVGHPVSKEESVDQLVAVLPFSSRDSKNLLNVISVQESISSGEVIA